MRGIEPLLAACIALTTLSQSWMGLLQKVSAVPEETYSPTGSLITHRGHVHSLVMGIHCDYCPPKVIWEYKISANEKWRNVSHVTQHRSLRDVYFLEGLQAGTRYNLRALFPLSQMYTATTESWTCPEGPPPLAPLRVAGAGWGWLDVRWTRSRENCASTVLYLVRYRAQGLAFHPERQYGVFATQDGFVDTKPLHPCPEPETDFCLLLTDRVRPGLNHTIEVRAKRYDIHDSAITEPQKVVVFAGSTDTRVQNGKSCPFAKEQEQGDEKKGGDHRSRGKRGRAGERGGGLEGEQVPFSIKLPLWGAVVAALVLAAAAAIAAWSSISICRIRTALAEADDFVQKPSKDFPSAHFYDYPKFPPKRPDIIVHYV